jgi:hypothetical protein
MITDRPGSTLIQVGAKELGAENKSKCKVWKPNLLAIDTVQYSTVACRISVRFSLHTKGDLLLTVFL